MSAAFSFQWHWCRRVDCVNKVPGIRALCRDIFSGNGAEHNDANILTMGMSSTGPAGMIVDTWLASPLQADAMRAGQALNALDQ